VILFASTFTPRLSAAPVLLDTLRLLAAKNRWHWRVNLHPKMPPEVVDAYRAARSEHFELVETDDTMSLLASAHAMLCDTSSILSEFLVQHRPAVTFRNANPADHLIDCSEPGQIEGALEAALSHPPELMANIRRYADDTHPWRDGRSSERTLDVIEALAARGTRHLSRKPLNAYRHYKMRRLLEYWRP
jgi:CDP-glycerol glycerophosphotransferase (TagB/SpsB family)